MELILIVILAIMVLLFVSIIILFIAAIIMDIIDYRRNRLFIELSRDHNKRRRPAAK